MTSAGRPGKPTAARRGLVGTTDAADLDAGRRPTPSPPIRTQTARSPSRDEDPDPASPWLPGPPVPPRVGADRFRVVSGRAQGELLRVVRREDGTVDRLYWATYAVTREPRVFGT